MAASECSDGIAIPCRSRPAFRLRTAPTRAHARFSRGSGSSLMGEASDGPAMDGDYVGWSVSYYVYVPRRFDLDLDAHNGGLSVDGVSGNLALNTHNGSVALVGVGGDVRAHTQNGSLNVQLTGTRWDGTGLDAETQNGSVRLAVPDQYAAQLETGTVNGSIRTDIPVTLSGRISRQLSIPLGGGGRTIRATTTNGSVSITRR
ncbi:MAG: hypothetical protein DMD35_00505 [Gemmatimonadetes bacterium]|nr:MAG: hypothetical protein DMD35_00505 [Gemmatimonadota bacterium]